MKRVRREAVRRAWREVVEGWAEVQDWAQRVSRACNGGVSVNPGVREEMREGTNGSHSLDYYEC